MPETYDARVDIDPDHHRGLVDRRLFGSFVEHMGRCVYTGIFEPAPVPTHRVSAKTSPSW